MGVTNPNEQNNFRSSNCTYDKHVLLQKCLPDSNTIITIDLAYPGTTSPDYEKQSYFDICMKGLSNVEGQTLVRNSWCVESNIVINPSLTHNSYIISSYVDTNFLSNFCNSHGFIYFNPDEIRKMNFMINNAHFLINNKSANAATWVEFQAALWTVLGQSIQNLPSEYRQNIVQYIVDYVNTNYSTWCPAYKNSLIGVFVYPIDNNGNPQQPQIVEFTYDELASYGCKDTQLALMQYFGCSDPETTDPDPPDPFPIIIKPCKRKCEKNFLCKGIIFSSLLFILTFTECTYNKYLKQK